jgi:hypothetical protein
MYSYSSETKICYFLAEFVLFSVFNNINFWSINQAFPIPFVLLQAFWIDSIRKRLEKMCTQVKAVRQETAGSCGFQRVPEAGFQNRFRRPYTACFLQIPEPGNDVRIRLPFPSRFLSTDTIIYQDDRIQAVSHRFRSGNEGWIRSFSDPLYSWHSAYRYDDKMCAVTGSFELLFDH